MTQIFDEEGRVHPATVLAAGPVTVTQRKEMEKDGYEAVQVAFKEGTEKHVAKPQQGHLKDLGLFRVIREFRIPKSAGEVTFSRGDVIDVTVFEKGDRVTVSSISKGKGFQGVVKRHGFAGGPRTHGQKHTERAPGSIGSTGPQRVFKGQKMAGRMGGERVTVKNLQVISVDAEKNQLIVRGAVPGRRGTLVEVRGK